MSYWDNIKGNAVVGKIYMGFCSSDDYHHHGPIFAVGCGDYTIQFNSSYDGLYHYIRSYVPDYNYWGSWKEL